MLFLMLLLFENLVIIVFFIFFKIKKKKDLFNQIDYIGKVTHDLRTPIYTINGFITLAKINPNNLNDYLLKVECITKKMLKIVNDSINYSKIKNNKLIIDNKLNNIIDCINLSITNVESLLINKNIKLINNIDIKHQNAIFDADKLYSIILNLLSNAYKYTNPGGYIYISVKEDNYFYSFEIKDNGIGMSKKYLKEIFKPFSKEYKIINDDAYSSGLGMSILKEMVDKMNGIIKISSKENVGTTIQLKFNFKE